MRASTTEPTARELMVVAAAREIREGELVFVGMRLPLLAFGLAKATHAPGAIGLYENGVVRESPSRELLYTMSDPPNVEGAARCGDMLEVMGLLQQGRVALGFVGAAEVDRFGNLNTTRVRDRERGTETRLPGSGGACDIAALAGRLVVLIPHRRHRLVERVDHVTSPGHGSGGAFREEVGLRGGGPCAIITDRGMLRFDERTKEAYLASVHDAADLEALLDETGFELPVPPACRPTRPPTADELSILRGLDPDRVWLGGASG